MRSKVYSDREIQGILKKNGFLMGKCKDSVRGDHFKYKNANGESIVVTRNMNPCAWQRLVKRHGLML